MIDLNSLLGTAPLAPSTVPVDDNLSNVGRVASRAQLVNGPLGTHGVVGDILGHLMDMALVQSGLKPEYSTRLQAAKDSDVLDGYDADPIAAINRVRAIDPARGDQMLNDLYSNIYKQQLAKTSAAAQAKDVAELPGVQSDAKTKVFGSIANLVNSPGAVKNWAAVRTYADKTLRANGLDTLADTLPSDPSGAKDWALGSVSVDKQADNARADLLAGNTVRHDKVIEGIEGMNAQTSRGQLGVAQQNANTNAQGKADQSRNIDSEIGYRAWQQTHGDAAENRRQDYENWLKNHPSKQRAAQAPADSDINYLKANPAKRAQFDAHFGAGAAAKILGN